MFEKTRIAFALIVALAALRCAWAGAAGHEPPPCRTVDPPAAQVAWIETADSSDADELSAACASVGPVVIRNYAMSDTRPVLDSLVVVTWNTHVGGGDVPGFVARLRGGDFTEGRPVRHFVLLLQEVFRAGEAVPAAAAAGAVPKRIAETPPSGERMEIPEVARVLGLNLFYAPSMKNGVADDGEAEEDRGNAVLSTLPLDEYAVIVLPLESRRRVALAVTVRIFDSSGECRTLRIANVHLATRTRFPRYLSSMGIGRLRQARAVVSALEGENLVLGGDFNTWGPRATERALSYLEDRFPPPEGVDERPTISVPFFPDRRVDYLFFRLSGDMTASYRRLDDRMGSDHHPLIGVIRAVR